MDQAFLQQHSSELLVLILSTFFFTTLLILVPQLLRAQQQFEAWRHEEYMRSLEKGLPLPQMDNRSLFAGRTAVLVPIVAIITAGTVTCFLIVYKSEIMFSVSLSIWTVAGVVGLAAITGGVALLGRIAQLTSGHVDEEFSETQTKPPP
jgi:hypothetical protein